MDFIGIIIIEYHVVDTWVVSHGHTNGINYGCHTWYYQWY